MKYRKNQDSMIFSKLKINDNQMFWLIINRLQIANDKNIDMSLTKFY